MEKCPGIEDGLPVMAPSVDFQTPPPVEPKYRYGVARDTSGGEWSGRHGRGDFAVLQTFEEVVELGAGFNGRHRGRTAASGSSCLLGGHRKRGEQDESKGQKCSICATTATHINIELSSPSKSLTATTHHARPSLYKSAKQGACSRGRPRPRVQKGRA